MSSNIQNNDNIIIDSLLLENQNLKQQVDLLKMLLNKNNMQQQFLNEENIFLKRQLDLYENTYLKR